MTIPPCAPRRFEAVTTCHAEGFDLYGRRMVESYLRHWPASVPLSFYGEGVSLPSAPGPAAVEHDLPTTCPGLEAFKQRHAGNPLARGESSATRWNPRFGQRKPGGGIDTRLRRHRQGYRWDAVRFSHKVFATLHAARHTPADVLIWIDADTRFFADVGTEQLETFVAPDRFVGFLARETTHSETGFVAYNLRHPATQRLLDDLEAMYTRDLLFDEDEFTDSYLFDVVRRRQEALGHRSQDIAGGRGRRRGHVLVNSPLGAFMDHLKGDRKTDGISRFSDLEVARPEGYWAGAR